MKNYIEEVLSSRDSLFLNESTLDFGHVPSKLPHRGDQLKRLANDFRVLLDKPGSVNPKVIVLGETGVGKTVLTKYFGNDLLRVARDRGVKLHFIYVNCRTVEGRWGFALNIARRLSPFDLHLKGCSPNQMLSEIYGYLGAKDEYLLLAIDEVDFFIKRTGQDVIYDLLRLNEEYPNSQRRIAPIFIARDRGIFHLPELDSSTISSLSGADVIELSPYDGDELKDILWQRVEVAFVENSVPGEVIDFIADIASAQGDARYAIELLWLAGKYADSEQGKRIEPDHVRKARAQTHPWIGRNELAGIPLDEKLILLAVTRSFKASDVFVNLREVEGVYRGCCEEWDQPRGGPSQLQRALMRLATIGLIDVKQDRGEVRVNIPNTPIGTLEHELEVELKDDVGRKTNHKGR